MVTLNHMASSGAPAESPAATAVYLVGMPGVGKSSVGVELARRLKRRFADADAIIAERSGRSVSALILERGERAFRRLEARVLTDLARRSDLVAAAGGGAVANEFLPADFFNNDNTVHLTASLEKIVERLNADLETRPLLGRPVTLEKARALWLERKPIFDRFSLTLNTDEGAPAELARRVERLLARDG